MWFAILIAALTSYLLGNLNGSVCISALMEDDVRKHGSGNAGLTNFFRNYGFAGTGLVLLVDMVKTALGCISASLMLERFGYGYEGLMLGAVAVSLGHDFPILLGFRGGKGILCGFTVALVLDWRVALIILAVFVITFAITRYVSLGSVLAAVGFGIGFAVLHSGNWVMVSGGIFLGLLALWMHRKNILRLIRGEETKTHLIHRDLNKQ
jgi:glycerol-3-phosphate acyltransferase PlsY